MKTQQNTWKFQTSVCLLALLLASGCANKNVAENEQVDGFAETGEKPADAASTEAAATEPAAGDSASTEAELFGDKGSKADTAATDPAAADATKTAAADPGAAPGDPAMESLFAPNQDPNASADPNFDELQGKTAANDATPAPDGGSSDPAVNADPLLATGTQSSPALQDPASPSDAKAFSGKPTFTEPKATYSGAILPKIPGRAMARKGVSLNRYYFLRQGDTPKSVSEMVYGDKSHAASLKKWNKGRWMAGKVVYYPSATQPDDAQMVSFYDERGLTADQYKVGKGETMSTIAKKSLGSISSWKELAVVNGLSRPDALKRGQTIKVYANLGSTPPAAQVVAENPEPVMPPPHQNAPTPVPEMAQNAPAAAVGGMAPPDAPALDPAADDLSKAKKKAAKQGVSLGKLISQNSLALTMGLGIGLLLIALMMINKRKRSNGGGGADDFSEDAFAAPEKKKRR